jgi:hypothetical protein
LGEAKPVTTCADLLADLEQAEDDQIALWEATAAAAAPTLELASTKVGWVEVDGDQLPTLGELVNRIHALGIGLSTWQYREQTSTTRTAITLPRACAPATTRVWINGVPLTYGAGEDYTLATTTLTLAYALEIGDLLTVASYGPPGD